MSDTPEKAAGNHYTPPDTEEMRALIQPLPPSPDQPQSIAYHRDPLGPHIIRVKTP